MRWFDALQPPAPDVFAAERAPALLARHRAVLHAVRATAGVPDTHWRALYLPLIEAFAEYAQDFPASEAHHHAGPGGMLRHSLDCMRRALELRRGRLLPQGAEASVIAERGDCWTYAVASAALLHDCGKAVTRLDIQLCDASGRARGRWIPWLGPLTAQATHYRIRFRRGDYALHERLGPLIARPLVPPAALQWLGDDLDLLGLWTAAIGGDAQGGGAIAELVLDADRGSVAHDLAADAVGSRLTSARARPLAERLAQGLRLLIDSGRLPLNRDGAAGWRVGEDFWLVSKRILDDLRAHLETEGHSGIPTRNDRLMDELQQSGYATPNGDRAIWEVEVSAPAWGRTHRLTCLRVPVRRLYADPAAAPAEFAGTITPSTAPASAPVIATDDAPGRTITLRFPSADGREQTAAAEGAQASPETASAVAARDAPMAGAPDTDGAEIAPPGGDDAGRRFLAWLTEGLNTGRLAINRPEARVHVTAQGLLLVSPAIFKDFDRANWSNAQKRFQKLKLNEKTASGENIFTYRVSGQRKSGRVKGFLIPDPARLFPDVALPDPNKHLTLITDG